MECYYDKNRLPSYYEKAVLPSFVSLNRSYTNPNPFTSHRAICQKIYSTQLVLRKQKDADGGERWLAGLERIPVHVGRI